MTTKANASSSPVHFGARVPREVADRFGELAAYHGRSVSAEIRFALVVFDNLATERYLASPAARAELGSDEQIEKARSRVAEERIEIWQAAFLPPRPLPIGDADLN